jgi:hypothetical protein
METPTRTAAAPPRQRPSPLATIGVLAESLAAILFAGIIIGALVAVPAESLRNIQMCYLVANILAYCSVVTSRHRGGASLMVAFFFLFFVALPASIQIDTGAFPFGSVYTATQLTSAYLLLSFAQFCIVVGVRLGERRSSRTIPLVRGLAVETAIRFSTVIVGACVLIMGVVGPSSLFTTRAELAAGAGADEGIDLQLLFVGRSLSLIGLLVILHVLSRSGPVLRRKVSPWALLGVAAGVCFCLNFPPSLPRFQLLGAVLALCALLLNLFRPFTKMAFTGIAVTFLFFLFPALKAIGSGGSVDVGAAFGNDVAAYLVRVDFDAFKQVADTIIYLQSQPIRMGENFLGVLLFWVPRSVWPDKPTHSGAVVTTALGYHYTNVSSPLPAEAILGFGPFGVAIVMGALGLLIARVEFRVRISVHLAEISTQPVLYALLIGFSTIILRGALNSVAPMFMSAFAAYLLLHFLARRGLREEPFGDGSEARPASRIPAPTSGAIRL